MMDVKGISIDNGELLRTPDPYQVPSKGYRIKALRVRRGLSQTQLGAFVGVSASSVSRAEQGKSSSKMEDKILDVLYKRFDEGKGKLKKRAMFYLKGFSEILIILILSSIIAVIFFPLVTKALFWVWGA